MTAAGMEASRQADWYFDLVSPFAYLQLHALDRLAPHIRIAPKPVLLGAILNHWGQIGPAEIAPKRLHTYRMVQWTAMRRDIPLRMPERHPFNPLRTLRLLCALDADLATVRKAFEFIFAEGRVPDNDDEFIALARHIGFSGDAIALSGQTSAKEKLRALTDEAISHGVFGVPTFRVDHELFWGDDATDMLLDYLHDPALFSRGEMARIADLPVGIVREAAKRQ